MKTLKGVKAFEKGLICRGFQFAENQTFTHDGEIEICEAGFHFCENPLDVLDYYDLVGSDFAEVEAMGESEKHDKDSKIVTNQLKVNGKIDLKGFIKLSFEYLWEKCKDNKKTSASGYSSQLAASGYHSKLAASGDYSQLAASGDSSQLDIMGQNGVGANIGKYGVIKGIVGTWITLAEYDDNNICVCVKSAKIDGKKLKADTWYRLENKKFIVVLT
jgi:hypothetical protein